MVKSVLVSKDCFRPQVGGISAMMWEICHALAPERICALAAVDPGAGLPRRMEGFRVFRKASPFATGALRQAIGLAAANADIGIRERPRLVQIADCWD